MLTTRTCRHRAARAAKVALSFHGSLHQPQPCSEEAGARDGKLVAGIGPIFLLVEFRRLHLASWYSCVIDNRANVVLSANVGGYSWMWENGPVV